MQTGILAAQIVGLEGLDRLDGSGADQIRLLRDARQMLERVDQGTCGSAQQRAGLAGDDGAVAQLNGSSRCAAGGFAAGVRLLFNFPCAHGQPGLIHQQFQLVALALLGGAGDLLLAQALVVPAHDLLAGGFAADGVVHDAVASHVHAHIRGGLVGALACDQLEHRVHHREDLDVAVIVHGGHAVGFQMEGVDHVHIVQVCGGGLVGQIDRVLQRNVPDGEGLELGVTGLDAALVFMVQLRQADGHFSAAGAGRGDDHQRALGLNVLVAAVALVADDACHIVGVAGDLVVAEGADAQTVQPLFKGFHLGGSGVLGHAHTAHIQPHLLKSVDETQHVQIVGDAVVAAHLAADDVLGADDDDDLGLLLELQKHLQLGVRLKAGQHAGSVIIVEQLAAEFQIQLIVKLLDALADMLRLHRKIFVVVKSYFHRSFPLWWPGTPYPDFKITSISIPQPGVGRNAKQSTKYNSGRIGRFGRYKVLFFVADAVLGQFFCRATRSFSTFQKARSRSPAAT